MTVATEHIHHIEPLTKRMDLACTETNCAALCAACHHRIERMNDANIDSTDRFPTTDRSNITLVCGPPGSGKSYHVAQHVSPSDLIVDLDVITAALTASDLYHATANILPIALQAFDAVVDAIGERGFRGGHVWIVATLPKKAQRDSIIRRLGGTIGVQVMLSVDEATCVARIQNDERRPDEVKVKQVAAVGVWWREYER